MNKFKTLSILIIGTLASIFFVGCSCSAKKVNPSKIEINVSQKVLYVGDSVDISYNVSPAKASKVNVDVAVSKENVVSLSNNSFSGVAGTVKITANAIDTEGVSVMFSIKNTNLRASAFIRVLPDPEALSAPTNLAFNPSDSSISFKSVSNTQGYVVSINDVEYDVTDIEDPTIQHDVKLPVFNTEVPLEFNKGYTVKVKSIGDGADYGNSIFSEEYKFIKYAQVSNITALNGRVEWDKNPLADKYYIKINGAEQVITPEESSYTLSEDTTPGSYDIEIAAASFEFENAQGYKVFTSNYSPVYTITKLQDVKPYLNNAKLIDGVVGNSVVTFTKVSQATAYEISVFPKISEVDSFEITTNEIEIDDRFEVGVNYTITIRAIGDAQTAINSGTKTIQFSKIGGTNDFSISNNMLTFNGLDRAGAYEIILSSQDETATINSPLPFTWVDLAEQLNIAGTYSVSVRALGLITDVLNVANGLVVNSNLTITKLPNPTITTIKNDGLAEWQPVSAATEYAVYLNGTFIANCIDAKYSLNAQDLLAQAHNLQVVAVGDGITTISSGVENALNFEFTKLNAVTQYQVVNDVLLFEAVSGAINYSISINGTTYQLNGNLAGGQQQYNLTSDIQNGENIIRIISVGDGIKNISSNIAEIAITRLEAPTNLQTKNGELKWDAVEGANYKIYIGNDEEGVVVETNSFNDFELVGEQQVVKVQALSKLGGYISSEFVSKNVYKLKTVQGLKVQNIADHNELANYKLEWDAVDNSSGYNIIITNRGGTSGGDTANINNNHFNYFHLPEGLGAGEYTVDIYALGNSIVGDGLGYINSQGVTFNFRKLSAPKNIKVENNKLVWSVEVGENPTRYKIGITVEGKEEEFINIGTEKARNFDFSNYGNADISVRIRSLGDSVKLVTSDYSEPVTISRTNQVENLSVKNGVITWNKHAQESAEYLVYIKADDGEFTLAENAVIKKGASISCTIPSLEEGKKYNIYVIASVQGLLHAEPSSTIEVEKLTAVTNFEINNKTFGWGAVANASKYIVLDNNGNTFEATDLLMEFSAFKYEQSGNYEFYIYAVGSTDNADINYLNSSFVLKSVNVTILSAPTSAVIEDNKLIITNNNQVLPEEYKIEFKHSNGVSVIYSTSNTEIDLNDIDFTQGKGSYEIFISSIGNNKNLIDTPTPFKLSSIIKIDEESLGLKIKNGEISWNGIENMIYDVYVDDRLVHENYTANTLVLDDIESNKEYKVHLIGKQDGHINSAPTQKLIVKKLPDVKDFKIVAKLEDEDTARYSYNFEWSAFDGDYNTELFSFKVVALNQDGQPLDQINGLTFNGETDGAQTLKEFIYNEEFNGKSYSFTIMAKGTQENNISGYLNGNMLANSITVTVLNSLSNFEYNRDTNILSFNNVNFNAGSIKIAYEKRRVNETDSREIVHHETIAGRDGVVKIVYPDEMDPGSYIIHVNPVGDIDNNILNAHNRTSYDLELIIAPSNVKLENGFISWTHPGGVGIGYQIFIDGVKFTYQKAIEVDEEITFETADIFTSVAEARIINEFITDTTNIKSIQVKAIREDDIDSHKSEPLQFKKLVDVSGTKYENHKLFWNSVDKATGYIIKCSNASGADVFGVEYDTNLGGVYVKGNNAGQGGYSLPSTLSAGAWGFYICAVGSNTDSTDSEVMGYLTTISGNAIPLTVISGVHTIHMNEGEIVWNKITGAQLYKVEIYKGKTMGGTYSQHMVDTNKITLDSSDYQEGFYVIKVHAIGNGSTNVNSSLNDFTECVVYKAQKAPDFKVRDGFISWSVPINSGYIWELNNREQYTTENNKQALLKAALGFEGDEVLMENLKHFRNLEVNINNKVYRNQTVFSIDLVGNYLVYKYDFYFDNLQNPYTISLRFIGSTTSANVENVQMSSVLSGCEEGVCGDETPTLSIPINVVSGNYTSSISGYRLATPQSPVVPGETMVHKDKLYFSAVYANEEFEEVDYLIVAQSYDQSKENRYMKINASNREDYYAETRDLVGSTTVAIYAVPVADILLEAGYTYVLSVRALGTADSDFVEQGKIYLTSYINQTCEVEMLQMARVLVRGGNIAIAGTSSALETELKIWSTNLGETFVKGATNKDDDKYSELIIISDDTMRDNPFIIIDGFGEFAYSLANNPLLPAGEYYVMCDAKGDGIEKISSGDNEKQIFTKFEKVQNIRLDGGYFKWDPVKVPYQPSNYLVTVYKKDKTNNNLIDTKNLVLSSESVLSSDGLACVFDLPSLDFPAVSKDTGASYDYAISVSAYGLHDSESDEEKSHPFVVTGDSALSGDYKRLAAPQNITMENGVLRWKNVDLAATYEVYLLNAELEEYSIITDGEYRHLTFPGDQFKDNAVFNLRVRAVPGSETSEWLTGEFSVEIEAKKLEMPNLRVVDGVVKWNNTDLNYEIATSISVKITQLEEDGTDGEVIFDKIVAFNNDMHTEKGYDLTAIDDSLPKGYYRFEIGYIGSNGYVTIDVEPEKLEDPENPENPENPEGPENPENPEEPQEPEEPTEPAPDYCWFSSEKASMVVYKLGTPQAELYIGGDDAENPANYVLSSIVDDATYYSFTVIKYDENNEIVKQHTFDKYSVNDTGREYFKTEEVEGVNKVWFNLSAVSYLDAQEHPDQPNPFGQEFTVYCQVFGQDSLYDGQELKYAISDKSNYVAVEVPVTPTNLNVEPSTGLVTWKNYSNNTKTRIKIDYDSPSDNRIYIVEKGISQFKLEKIGNFSIRISSFIEAQDEKEIASAYTDVLNSEFKIFDSGEGTEDSPYMISSTSHLLNIDHYLESYYKISNNIEITGSDLNRFSNHVIGKNGGVFNGTIDGDGKQINNLQFAYALGTGNVSMIKEIGERGVVKNLKVSLTSNQDTSKPYMVSNFAGITTTNRGEIKNVEILDTTIGVKYRSSGNQMISAVVYENYGTIVNTISNLKIDFVDQILGMETQVSGIAISNYGTIEKSGNKGSLSGSYVGGIVCVNNGKISQCFNTGDIKSIVYQPSKQAMAGGIAAQNTTGGTISSCYVVMNSFEIINAEHVQDKGAGGGIVGDNNSGELEKLEKCYVAINSITSTNSYFGVIAGYDNRVNIENYYTKNHNHYLVSQDFNMLGSGENTSIATKAPDKASLITKMIEFNDLYKSDANNINNGYPVFLWQS